MLRRAPLIAFLLASGLGLPGARGAPVPPRPESPDRILFTNLTEADGLSAGAIRGILQDRQGFIWIATPNGLDRYDGYETVHYRHDPADPNTISGNDITAIFKDTRGQLWIGTRERGLNHFDTFSEKMVRHRHDPSDPESLSHDTITSICQDGRGGLWIGTHNGLNRFDFRSGTFERFTGVPGYAGALTSDVITSLFTDRHSRLWIGTAGGGLLRFDPESRAFIPFWDPGVAIGPITENPDGLLWVGTQGQGLTLIDPGSGAARTLTHDPETRGGLPSHDVRSVLCDSFGMLWAGTARGLSRLDPATETLTTFRHHPHDPSTLSHDDVTWIFEDKKNVLWVGTSRGGISRFHLERRWFPHYRFAADGPSRLGRDALWGMCQDAKGIVWMGSESGLNRFDPATGELVAWPLKLAGEDLAEPYIRTLFEDRRQRLWLGTVGGGLLRLEPDRTQLTVFRHHPDDPSTLPDNTVNAIAEDRDGTLWVAAQDEGLCRFDESENRFISPGIASGGEALPGTSRSITVIQPAPGSDRLWLGTLGGGLFAFDSRSFHTTHYRSLPGVTEALSSSHIAVIQPGPGESLWIGTIGGGLDRFDPATGEITHYLSQGSGLPQREIHGIIPLSDGVVWVSTEDGLARFDSVKASARFFDLADGLQGERFHSRSVHAGRDGRLYFGGANGFNHIDPSNLPHERHPQRAVLSGLELFGERVLPAPGGVLDRPLALTDVLRLPFDPRSRIGLSFATLDYAMPHNSRFRYRLEGLDDSWNPCGAERKATYAGLASGDYTFLVQASLDGEHWNEDSARLQIRITPPWHATSWARSLFAALALGLFFGVLDIRTRIVSEKARRRQAELERDRNRAETALARQLQHAMLLGQTNRNFRHNINGGEVFEKTLHHLGTHFGIDRCHIHSYSTDPAPHAELLAEYAAEGLASIRGAGFLEATAPLVVRIVAADNAIVSTDVHADFAHRRIRDEMATTQTRSFAAVRTSHLDRPNGFIILESCRKPRLWEDDEMQLLEAVAGQIGIAIAHLELTQREEEQRRELESAKREAEIANQAKSDFLAKITHELRTPLNSIIGFSRMIHEDDATTGTQRELINIVNSSGEHLLDIINDILEMSKIEAGREELIPERFDLRDLLASVAAMLRPRAEAQELILDLEVTEPIPRSILADKGKIRQILTNLLGNSLKFTQAGSVTLSVTAGEGRKRKDLGASDPLRGPIRPLTLHFEVRDTGKGISEEELPTLFEKFVQTDSGRVSHQGTGLGLAISRSFVELMGGSISARSCVGIGTTFAFDIHCHEVLEEAPRDATARISRRPRRLAPGQEEILILGADDQPMNRLLAVRLLEKAGFTIQEAENGAIALEKWRAWRPHLILMDEEMPLMRGREATAAILEEAGDHPPVIIALTAYALEDARLAALQAGSKDFLAKPFTHEALFEVIARHLDIRYLDQDELPGLPNSRLHA